MNKLLLLLLFLAGFVLLNAQKISINGKVENREKKPIENATVFLLKQKDSTIINYTSTTKEGSFSLKIDPISEPSILRIDADKFFQFSKKYELIDKSVQLENIVMEKDSTFNIEEVRLTKSPVKIKKDTIEFSASAIKVRPDSKAEELLKKIPGIEIGNDGKITSNGKEVDQILINGKPFFDKDGKIALQNLPADIIKSIQITTTKTKEEETSGKTAKSNNATINLTIDEKKNKGLISRITVGYGSDERYEGSALISYFKKDTKASILASSNNINSQGFSNDEIFDSMGRGRNSWLMQGSTVTVKGNSTIYTSGGNTKGIQKSSTAGFNYNDKISKETDLNNMSGIYLKNNLETHSKVSRNTLLPEYSLQTDSENSGENDNDQFNFNTSVRIKPDTLTSIYISPFFSSTKGTSINRNTSSTSKDFQKLNDNNSFQKNDSDYKSFNSNIYFSRKLKKKGRNINANINSDFNGSNNRSLTQSSTIFYQSGQQNDIRNQITNNKSNYENYSFSTGFDEPIKDSMNLSFEMRYSQRSDRDLKNVFDYNSNSGDYSLFNSLLSNDMLQKTSEWTPELSFNIDKKKINFWASLDTDFTEMKVNSKYNGQIYDLKKNYILPNYNINMNYNFSENKRMSLYHYSNFEIPSVEQLTPYEDLSNPLISYKGNPELKPTWRNQTYFYFNNYNMVKNISYYANFGFNYSDNSITNYSYYDSSGKQFVTYDNVSGNKYFNVGFYFTKTYKWKENKFSINPRINSYYSFNKGFVESKPFSSETFNISPGLNFNFEIKDKVIIKPSYSLNYSSSRYKNFSINEAQNSSSQIKLELTNYFFKTNFVIGNDFQYNTNSNIAPGFKKDFYFWNTSLGYSFYKKQFITKVKVYDVLNQNQSVNRVIAGTYFEDREDLILKRYIMFSLTMKLNKFANKKEK